MKAIVYDGMKEVKVKKVDDPAIMLPDDVIVKVTSTAICGSDLHLYHGVIPGVPRGFVLGHETMGIVEEIGKEVHKMKRGDRVVIPFPIACGHCYYCEHELWSQCDNSNPDGETGAVFGFGKNFGNYAGGQAEFLRVPYANVGPVLIPDEITDDQALFLTDILPTAYWGVENGRVRRDDTVIVLGCGPVGLLAVKWAAFKGAGRIIAVDWVGYRLQHARTYPGVETVNLEDQEDTGNYLQEITGGGADVVIDCVGLDGKMTVIEKLETMVRLQGGSKSAVETAVQAVRKGGTISVVGNYGGVYNLFPFGDLYLKNVTLKMGLCPAHTYVEPILQLIKAGKFDATDIITHRLSLEQGPHAYKIFDKKEDHCIKVVLKP